MRGHDGGQLANQLWHCHLPLPLYVQDDLDPLKVQLRKRDKLLTQAQGAAGAEAMQAAEAGQQQGADALQGAAGGDARQGAEAAPHTALASAAAGGPAGAVAPMPTVQRVNAADAAQWRRTDNIIMAVLSRWVGV